MATFDISPMFRSAREGAPAYNILRTGEEEFRISLALPGWQRDQITVHTQNRTLWVKGERRVDPDHNQYLYRGIGMDSFQRTFELPEHVLVREARLHNGMLNVELVRELPEALRPRKIEIHAEDSSPVVLSDASKAA